MIKNQEIINAAIPDNIDKLASWLLQHHNLRVHDLKRIAPRQKARLLFEFVKAHPEVLQYKLF
jgi:hypothetical protein